MRSSDLVFRFPGSPVVRDEGVVDSYLERAFGQQAGYLFGEQPVRLLEKRLQRKMPETVSHRALARGPLVLLAYPVGGGPSGGSQCEHAGYVVRRIHTAGSLAKQTEDPEHRCLDDFLGSDPCPRVLTARVVCPTSTCSLGALRGSVIPSTVHVCTNTGTGGMIPSRL